jgi:hypothetical protein
MMSSIQSNSAAIRGVIDSRRDSALPQTPQNRKTEPSSDAALMHAWSIGTTRAASAGSEKSKVGKSEDCPPEVYIG